MRLKHVKLEKLNKIVKLHEIIASFFCFALISHKFAQILNYFAQSCDGMIAAFRNSAHTLRTLSEFIFVALKIIK